MRKIKVLLTDDHNIVLEGLQVVLSQNEHIEIIGCVNNGEEAIAFIRNNKVDVIIMDINMPVMDGLTCSKVLKKDYPEIKIIILTMYPQRSFVDQILKIGVDGCLLKNNSGDELVAAIDRVISGKSYYDLIKNFKSNDEHVVQFKLSDREIQIIKALTDGKTSAQIAEELFISIHTVQTHRKNILRKTKMENTTRLIQFAIEQQLI